MTTILAVNQSAGEPREFLFMGLDYDAWPS